jgi:hypothetical protein
MIDAWAIDTASPRLLCICPMTSRLALAHKEADSTRLHSSAFTRGVLEGGRGFPCHPQQQEWPPQTKR